MRSSELGSALSHQNPIRGFMVQAPLKEAEAYLKACAEKGRVRERQREREGDNKRR